MNLNWALKAGKGVFFNDLCFQKNLYRKIWIFVCCKNGQSLIGKKLWPLDLKYYADMLQNPSPWRGEAAGLDMREGRRGLIPGGQEPTHPCKLAHRQYFPKNSFKPRSMHSKHRICMSTFQIGSEGKLNIFLVVGFNWLDSIKQFLCCAMISPI